MNLRDRICNGCTEVRASFGDHLFQQKDYDIVYQSIDIIMLISSGYMYNIKKKTHKMIWSKY